MRSNIDCEIYVESVERWIPAHIDKMNLVHVPNTDIVMKTFDVKYLYATEQEYESNPLNGVERKERDIHSDRLRLLVDENLETKEMREDKIAEDDRRKAQVKAKKIDIDENTGKLVLHLILHYNHLM